MTWRRRSLPLPLQALRYHCRSRCRRCGMMWNLSIRREGYGSVTTDWIEIERGEPTIAGSGLSVAEVVRACHDKTVEAGLAGLAVPRLDKTTIEPVLTYCAEQRCKDDAATCPGCRMRTEALGL